ncbi:MAG: hypothetical protein K9K82_04720 [Desulfobacteraceae bacterium]|nr:hypothetical protein [Desulfobacteraceae bacterium]
MERLEKSDLWLAQWLKHQRRDDFWKHGSVCEDYSAIRCPVMAVSGWADGYSNAVFRILANLDVPRKGLIGPWSHLYPHMGHPGPAIGFLQEAIRWWDTWLKGDATGIMEEPMLRVWMQESVPPTTDCDYRPGCWVAETGWPGKNTSPQVFHLGFAWLGPEEKIEQSFPVSIQSPLSVGLYAGNRIRLAVSTVYWPLAWPSPEPTRLTIYTRTSRLLLPVRQKETKDKELRPFGPIPLFYAAVKNGFADRRMTGRFHPKIWCPRQESNLRHMD